MPSSQETSSTENVKSVDVPPTEKRDGVEDNPVCEPSEHFVFNDPNKVGDMESPRSVNTPTEHIEENTPETMEVDGATKDVQEEAATVDEETTTEPKETEEVEEEVQESEESKENMKNEHDDILDVSTELPDQPPPQEEVSEFDYQHHSETDNSQCNEDEDDNSQSSQDTTQSQEASVDTKNQENINRAILEDWEDTDSQQSEKQRAAMKQAAENVNKLMDDWEEEDEDDKKDDDLLLL